MSRLKLIALQSLPGFALAVAWEALIFFMPDYRFFLGSPLGVLGEMRNLIASGRLVRDTAVTALEALLGFTAGGSLGTLIGLALWGSERVYFISRPYLIALGSVPAFALGPVLIFWFGTGIWSKVAMGFLATFVIAVVQAYTGAMETDSNLLRMVQAFGGSRWQMFSRIIVPSAAIWVLSGIRLNIGMALLGAFVGEFISSSMGLGNLIILAEGLYNVNQIWVGCFGVVVVAISFNVLTAPVERWARRWQ